MIAHTIHIFLSIQRGWLNVIKIQTVKKDHIYKIEQNNAGDKEREEKISIYNHDYHDMKNVWLTSTTQDCMSINPTKLITQNVINSSWHLFTELNNTTGKYKIKKQIWMYLQK